MVGKEISTLASDSSDNALPWMSEKAHVGDRSAIYSVVEQIVFHLLPRTVMDEILQKHITDYSDQGDAVDRICEKLLSTNAFCRRPKRS